MTAENHLISYILPSLLLLACGAFAQPVSPELAGGSAEPSRATAPYRLPDAAGKAVDEAVARFRAWKGDDETIAFTWMSDIHSHRTEPAPAEQPDFADTRYHPLIAMACADRAECDFLVDGGDHDYDVGSKSDEEALKRMAVAEASYRGYAAKPVLFCLGNHDHGPYLGRPTRPISSEMFGDVFNGLAEKHGFKLTFGANRSWGYYDVPKKKFRAIFCNTSDEAYYGLSSNQIAFVSQTLASMPEGWSAAVFGHFCVLNEIGHWKQYQSTDVAAGKAAFMKALEDFAAARPNALVGYFAGDSHFDNQLELRGVNWTITQGYAGVDRANLPWGARRVEFDRTKEPLFELVAIKPSKGQFRVFRVGAGGAAYDRTCDYFFKY